VDIHAHYTCKVVSQLFSACLAAAHTTHHLAWECTCYRFAPVSLPHQLPSPSEGGDLCESRVVRC
jgi:hypothetical protein